MPAWLIAALKMLAGGALLGVGSEVGATLGGADLRLVGGAQSGIANVLGTDPVTGAFVELPTRRRRRRRRALTASDRADIAFIAGILGPKAGKDIAAIIAART